MMCFSWTIISVAQIYTNRYLRHKWQWRQILHSVLGFLTMLITLAAALIAANVYGFIFDHSLHEKLGIAMCVLAAVVGIGGMATSFIKFKKSGDWDTKSRLQMSRVHGIFAYLIIIFS